MGSPEEHSHSPQPDSQSPGVPRHPRPPPLEHRDLTGELSAERNRLSRTQARLCLQLLNLERAFGSLYPYALPLPTAKATLERNNLGGAGRPRGKRASLRLGHPQLCHVPATRPAPSSAGGTPAGSRTAGGSGGRCSGRADSAFLSRLLSLPSRLGLRPHGGRVSRPAAWRSLPATSDGRKNCCCPPHRQGSPGSGSCAQGRGAGSRQPVPPPRPSEALWRGDAHLAQRTQLMCWLSENKNFWR